ncbi:uncharacterized protein LOC129976008 [Argiope bruennichi]|uniref:uncharacterized protein LOC129976008 n=1 Tax=Argiope bruennichi TaxID=94029 RepID=UPI0024949211|nr:uncharacterized protein LOC129976008 [Argiope bruennichi]
MKRTVMQLWILQSLILMTCGNPTGRISTVNDVLQLVYQLCSTSEDLRQERLSCVSSHMGKEVVPVMEQCMADPRDTNTTHSVKEFCEQLTHVPEWVAKHASPPPQLTRVMGLAALGRMACVLGEVQRPLPMWQASFAKCFPEFQSTTSLKKDSIKNRSENTLSEGAE